MQLDLFDMSHAPGALVPISGTDPAFGPWEHRAFAPHPLPQTEPDLSPSTYRQVARTRSALARLDSTARQLANPGLLRRPVLRREAQSTSALEGTYAPLSEVLGADQNAPGTTDMREILNYVSMADQAFAWVAEGRPLTTGLLTDLQGVLVDETPSAARWAAQLRGEQVVIGRRSDAPSRAPAVHAARFVPTPPGQDLEVRVRDLVSWMNGDHGHAIDPVVAAAMAHYQFETLHPFFDGNGRVGRLLIVLGLLIDGELSEPTLSVSPWFETRRGDYYDRLLGVSTMGDWDRWVEFFSTGLEAAARDTHARMLALLQVREAFIERIDGSNLRSANANKLVDLAVSETSFSVRQVEASLGVTYARANKLVRQLTELGVLAQVGGEATYGRRFHAPAVTDVLLDN